jgi:hypothetical protein
VIEAIATAVGSACTAGDVEHLAFGFLGSAHVVLVVDVQVSTDVVFRAQQPRTE